MDPVCCSPGRLTSISKLVENQRCRTEQPRRGCSGPDLAFSNFPISPRDTIFLLKTCHFDGVHPMILGNPLQLAEQTLQTTPKPNHPEKNPFFFKKKWPTTKNKFSVCQVKTKAMDFDPPPPASGSCHPSPQSSSSSSSKVLLAAISALPQLESASANLPQDLLQALARK